MAGNINLALGPMFLLLSWNWSLLSEETITVIQIRNDEGLNQSKLGVTKIENRLGWPFKERIGKTMDDRDWRRRLTL